MAAISGSTLTSKGWNVRGKSAAVVNNVLHCKCRMRSGEKGILRVDGSTTLSKISRDSG